MSMTTDYPDSALTALGKQADTDGDAGITYPPCQVRATARLQFHQGFTFADAIALVDYFAALGISHLYASPLLTSRQGSTHGYDTVDPTQINSELGGEDGLRQLVAKLRSVGMGLIVDIVPNHMGVGGSENAWWQHVLEWGASSPYARWFDINWHSLDPALHNKLLAPFLGAAYGDTLKSGDLKLQFNAENGRLQLQYHSHHFPIAIKDYAHILTMANSELLRPVLIRVEEIDWTRPYAEIQAGAALVQQHLYNLGQTVEGGAAIHAALAQFDSSQPAGRLALHTLLERQHYRLTWWRNGADEINWRRFFEVSELAGMRMEQAEVFEATHAMIFQYYAEGLIDGLRIDHVDGLADPGGYCRQLRQRLLHLLPQRPPQYRQQPYIVIEKILAEHETLRQDWQVDGTTGYDFMDQVGAVLHDPSGEIPLSYLWRKLTGDKLQFSQHVHNSRRQLLAENLISEFEGCAQALHAIARADIDTRDYSLATMRRVLREILLNFPVYRTYASSAGRDEIDQQVFEQAAQKARLSLNNIDRPVVDVLSRWLSGDVLQGNEAALAPSDDTSSASTPETEHAAQTATDRNTLCQRAITRFQQLTPPLAAKSVEDTAFYRYGRLLSRNEVGSDPSTFSIGVLDFHARCLQRQEQFPLSMLATATHDHKRGEDARSRITVLSEMPVVWGQTLEDWMQMNARFRSRVLEEDGLTPAYKGPRAWHEVMLYEMIVGAWPLDLEIGDQPGLRAFAERLSEWQTKSIREAKRLSNWVQNNEAYESACTDFLFNILDARINGEYLAQLHRFVQALAPLGAINSLTQTVLRLTVPGMPDLYQGTELWDWSLVDPDNRRPVDFAYRQSLLAADTDVQALLADWKSGAIKLHLLQKSLLLRQQHPQLFSQGSYLPLLVQGAMADHVIAFMRRHGDVAALTIVTRLPYGLQKAEARGGIVISAQTWQDTHIVLPPGYNVILQDIYTGQWHQAELARGNAQSKTQATLNVSTLLAQLPQALLVSGM